MSTNSHDKIFKATFSSIQNVEGELRSVLPAELIKRMDFSTLRRCSGSSVDSLLKELHSDALFDVRVAGLEALVCILLEHQSRGFRMMPYRMLRYQIRPWDHHLLENPNARRLPLILPIVVSNARRKWTGPTCVSQLIDVDDGLREALGDHIPKLRFILDDLITLDDAALRARPLTAGGRLGLLLLKNLRGARDAVAAIVREARLLKETLAEPGGAGALRAIFQYTLEVDSTLDEQRLIRAVGPILGRYGQEVTMATLRQVRQQGLEQGLEQGRQEGAALFLGRLLRLRFQSIPEAAARKLLAADAQQLERWGERVLTADSIAAVFAED